MLLAILLCGTGLYLSVGSYYGAQWSLVLVRSWTLICFGCILLYIFLSPDVDGSVDFPRYQAWYQTLKRGESNVHAYVFEFGFEWLARIAASLAIPFRMFIAAIAFMVMLSVYVLTRIITQPRDLAAVLFLYMNFFAFYILIYHAVRSGLSMAFVLLAIAALLNGARIVSFLLIMIAATFHTASLFALLIFITAVPVLRVQHFFAINMGLFLSSILGLNEVLAGRLIAYMPSLAIGKYETYAGMSSAYYPRLRLDFFLFTFAPLFVYCLIRWSRRRHAREEQDGKLHLFMQMYALLMIPFSFFAFMPFSDRFALFCWALWPLAITATLMYGVALPVIERALTRLVIIALLVGVANVLQYKTTLVSVATEIQDQIVSRF